MTKQLIVNKASKSYGKKIVVRDVSLLVSSGEAIAILGPNGAGKTTCFYGIVGLVKFTSGEVLLNGERINHLPTYERARRGLGYLPQESSIFRGLSVEQNIMAVLEIIESNKEKRLTTLERLLFEFDIIQIRKSMATSLSGGERRRVEIARALASEPDFILLDEPFAGIDPIAVKEIRQMVLHLKDRGIGVIITDHNVREALEIVDRAYIMYDGKILMEGLPNEIVASAEVRRFYLGDEFVVG